MSKFITLPCGCCIETIGEKDGIHRSLCQLHGSAKDMQDLLRSMDRAKAPAPSSQGWHLNLTKFLPTINHLITPKS